ncbi:mCG1045719, partial [Mus musculus]
SQHREEMPHLCVIVTEMKSDFRSPENIRQLRKPPVKCRLHCLDTSACLGQPLTQGRSGSETSGAQ